MKTYFCDEKYCIVSPSEVKDITEEALILGHDAGSYAYIQGILQGKWLIVFMRSNEDPHTPLITLEVRNQKVSISAGKSNRSPTVEEAEFIKKYNAHLASEACDDQHYKKTEQYLHADKIMKDDESNLVFLDSCGVEVDRKDRSQILKALSKGQWSFQNRDYWQGNKKSA